MQFDFATVLVFLVAAVAFALTNLLVGSFLRPKFPDFNKETIYECGERPTGQAWMNFNPRFYLIALAFVLFEVEVALTLPVAVAFRKWLKADGAEGRSGTIALVEIVAFVAVLAVGLVWLWARRDLEWLKRVAKAGER